MADYIDDAFDEVVGGEVKLTGKQAKKDEALWTDEHTSDEEEFDPNAPEDLTTKTQKEEAEEDEDAGEPTNSQPGEDEEPEEDEDEDDSIVNDEIEDACKDHDACIAIAKALDKLCLSMGKKARFGDAERRAALAETVCDNYQ
jgi:hypothetical protein